MQNQLKGLNQFSTLLNYQEENPITQPTPELRHWSQKRQQNFSYQQVTV